jgi:hypothetical protein
MASGCEGGRGRTAIATAAIVFCQVRAFAGAGPTTFSFTYCTMRLRFSPMTHTCAATSRPHHGHTESAGVRGERALTALSHMSSLR